MREWSIEVLPAYLRWGRPGPGQATIARMMVDLLALRRALIVEVVRLVAPRITPGSTAAARAALERAWLLRDAGTAFQEEDFQVMRAVVDGAGFLPAVWMLNRMSGVYLEVARTLSEAFKPPADYHESHVKFLDALDRGDGDAACRHIGDYLERHDSALVSALEVFA
ncbi:MAG: FCD domain-containing protein [Myxococcales bacterium]|nr:FCD domain-containing protein [Myxococcales bacterium]